MKYTYVIFMCMLFFISACETINKKPEPAATKKTITVDIDTCWITYVLVVNLPSKTKYNKKYFRKALAYSLDRKKLFDMLCDWTPKEYLLDSNWNCFGGPGIHGIIPPAFPEYDSKSINGYTLNEDSANYYLKKSKYSLNNKLTLQYWPDHVFIDYAPYIEISMQWKKYLGLPWTYTNILTKGERNKLAFSGEEGICLLPITKYQKPEEYLGLFYSKNDALYPLTDSIQKTYKNSEFDTYYEAGLHAQSRAEAIVNFKAAEQVLIDDAVVIPLFYSVY